MAAPWEDGDVEEEEDEAEEVVKDPSRDNVICVVDARENMFVAGKDGKTPFAMVLECLVRVLKNKIITSENDMFGVLFAGTKTTKNLNNFANLHFAVELDNPSASMIKQLEALATGASDWSTIGSLGADAVLPLNHAIWACSNAFASGKAKAEDYRRIWVFTNDDNPTQSDATERRNAIQKAKDCAEVGEEILLYCIPTVSGKPFDTSKIWRHIATAEDEDGNPTDNVVTMSEDGTFENLIDRIRVKSYVKRTYARLPMSVGVDTGIKLGVSLYFNIYPAKKPTATYVDGRTNAPLKIESSWLCKDTGKRLLPHEIKTYFPFGGDKVFFDKDDIKALKAFGSEPGLVVLGFKPATTIADVHNLRSPYFVYPNESDTIGGTTAFIALHSQMMAMNKVAIARIIMRAGTAPRLVALVAQPEVTEEGQQTSPPGMYAIPLPFADDFRLVGLGEKGAQSYVTVDPEGDATLTAAAAEENAAIAAAEAVINKLRMKKFSCHNFENPTLQKHFAVMQALALGEDEVPWKPESDDHLMPDLDGMAKFTAELEAFRDAIGVDAAADDAPKKRRAPAASSAAAKKPAKRSRAAAGDGKEGDDGAGDGEDWAKHAANDTLKECLSGLGLRVSGKKQELIDRIKQHYGVA